MTLALPVLKEAVRISWVLCQLLPSPGFAAEACNLPTLLLMRFQPAVSTGRLGCS